MDKLVFYDTEKEFTLAFSRYLSRRASLPCQVETFTEEAPLAACLASRTPLLLLTTKKDYTEELARLAGPSVPVVFLSEASGPDSICKYQDAPAITRELLARLRSLCPDAAAATAAAARLIGVTVPCGDPSSEQVALSLALLLQSRGFSVLYASLRPFPGLLDAAGGGRSLSDLLFALTVSGAADPGLFAAKLGPLSSLPPARPEDLADMKSDDWQRLFACLSGQSSFERVVLDLPPYLPGMPALAGLLDAFFAAETEGSAGRTAFDAFGKAVYPDGGVPGSVRFFLPETLTGPPDRESGLARLPFGVAGRIARELAARDPALFREDPHDS